MSWSGQAPFPPLDHDDAGQLVQESGTIDFGQRVDGSAGDRTPWGEQDSPAVVAAVDHALDSLSSAIMSGGAKPKFRTIGKARTSCAPSEESTDVYLILDGLFVVEVDRHQVGEIGPGAVVGERAALVSGKRTATVWARTPGRVASVPHEALDPDAQGHWRAGVRAGPSRSPTRQGGSAMTATITAALALTPSRPRAAISPVSRGSSASSLGFSFVVTVAVVASGPSRPFSRSRWLWLPRSSPSACHGAKAAGRQDDSSAS